MIWVKSNDYYNIDVIKCNVYFTQVTKKRKVYLQDKLDFTYTFDCGAYSEYSFSGCFFGTNINTLEGAKKYLSEYIPLYFANDFKGINKLKASIKLK